MNTEFPIRPKTILGPTSPNFSTALYCDPPSHDFCVWLIMAEMSRRFHNSPGPLKVKFGLIDGMLGKYDFGPVPVTEGRAVSTSLTRHYFLTMIDGIMRPAMAMLNAEEAPAIELQQPNVFDNLAGWVEYDHHIGALVDAGKAGFKPPQWQLPFQIPQRYIEDKEGVITITLRETTSQPERNSQLGEWYKFALQLESKGYRVIFIRDTSHALDQIGRFETSPLASSDACFRVALYQSALINFMVSNGPNVWVIFSDAPYLIFKQLVPALPDWEHGNAKGWRDQDHMEIGDQYGWATPLQCLTWTDDTYPNICAAFEQIEDQLR